MLDRDYVREYFSKHASEWIAGAYGEGTIPERYPIAAHRVRLAIEAVVHRVGSSKCRLVDLGCGGGELCFHAARLGIHATGIDIAEGMISRARKELGALPEEIQGRLRFVIGDVLDGKILADNYDAVTALGLVEYLQEDDLFFRTAYSLLRAGGVLVVSCRNRLFNMASLNEYTTREVERTFALNLLREIASLTSDEIPIVTMDAFVRRLKSTIPRLEEALQLDLKRKNQKSPAREGPPKFGRQRRQHTPRELRLSAEAAGFVKPAFVGVHPHPLPPRLETAAPHFYNQLASVFEVFENSPLSLLWSSAFIGVFSKRE